MKRRNFVHLTTSVSLALGIPIYGYAFGGQNHSASLSGYRNLVDTLLTEWCDGMLAVQIDQAEDPTVHGALGCPACNKIHGRCMDAVYPFMHMAHKTGEEKYLQAAIDVMKWSENVSSPDGSWTVIPDPKSWKGITVFGAIALGEALHHHGDILPTEIKSQWIERLKRAADFVHRNFTIDYSHVNYAFTAVYALNFLGRMFDNQDYIDHSHQLASLVPEWLTTPNGLIFGENKPADEPSAKGLLPVDLGYNVEETLNGLVQYAVLEQDEEMLKLLQTSMESHLEFMLPDGAWDNSWGTRQNKWSYWGSRTTDGCQPAFSLMAEGNPAFGTAAYLNTELLQRCTVNGLLAGGPHYESHGVKPCVHHSFAHAKSLAFILDNFKKFKGISKEVPLPRSVADGIRHFPEIDVWLAARGLWRATVSAYDVIFKKKYSQAATGGALAVLWHEKVGPVFMASMAEYILVEVNNQQPQPDAEDIPLTPRLECTKDGIWYSNLFDLKAEVTTKDTNGKITFTVHTRLTDRDRNPLPDDSYNLVYEIDDTKTVITAQKRITAPNGAAAKSNDNVNKNNNDDEVTLAFPVISPTGEEVVAISENRIEIIKEDAKVVIDANVPIRIKETKKDLIFNMVPGMEALPILATFTETQPKMVCSISIAPL